MYKYILRMRHNIGTLITNNIASMKDELIFNQLTKETTSEIVVSFNTLDDFMTFAIDNDIDSIYKVQGLDNYVAIQILAG